LTSLNQGGSSSSGQAGGAPDSQQVQLLVAGLTPLPGPIAALGNQPERELLVKAFNHAMHAAASTLDDTWMGVLLQQRQALGLPPDVVLYDHLMHLGLWQGSTPEVLEVSSGD
jgi:hypothetical protein